MRMRLALIIAVVLGFALLPNPFAQNAGAVIDASAKAMGSTILQSIQYSGTGTDNSVGQAFTSGGPWPRYKVTKYVGSINFTVPAMRQEIVRIDNERPPRGGGAGGFNPATGHKAASGRFRAISSRIKLRMDAPKSERSTYGSHRMGS